MGFASSRRMEKQKRRMEELSNEDGVFWLYRITLYGSGRSNRIPVQRLCWVPVSHRPNPNAFQSL
jgi:hypothetical protein